LTQSDYPFSDKESSKDRLVGEISGEYEIDLRQRLLEFSVLVIQFLSTFPNQKELNVFRYQLSKSATSVGANYEEAQNATFLEFVNRIRICVREASETHYWFKIIDKLELGSDGSRKHLLKESSEIVRIFGSILSKVAKSGQRQSHSK